MKCAGLTPEQPARRAVEYWQAEIAHAREVTAAAPLEQTFARANGETISLRWILVHVIEEYARHNGGPPPMKA